MRRSSSDSTLAQPQGWRMRAAPWRAEAVVALCPSRRARPSPMCGAACRAWPILRACPSATRVRAAWQCLWAAAGQGVACSCRKQCAWQQFECTFPPRSSHAPPTPLPCHAPSLPPRALRAQFWGAALPAPSGRPPAAAAGALALGRGGSVFAAASRAAGPAGGGSVPGRLPGPADRCELPCPC